MTNQKKLFELECKLKNQYSPILTELELFDYGAEVLRIYCKNRYFIVAVINGDCVLMDEPNEDDGFTSSFRHRFANIALATEALLKLIDSEP